MQRLATALLVFCTLTVAGCAAPPKKSVPANNSSPLQGGYLSREAVPNGANFLPPPPSATSAAQAADIETYRKTRALREGPRWALAQQDASLRFPAAFGTFSCAVGAPIDESATPQLTVLLRRSLTDAALATYGAKNLYARKRPFAELQESSCTPQDESRLARDGSYPSGHSAIGWAWALILAELAPDRTEAIIARGHAFGQSRVVCGVHWQSDADEGRTVASAVIARLHGEPAFVADLHGAKTELDAARAKGLAPSRDCDLEATQLATKTAGVP